MISAFHSVVVEVSAFDVGVRDYSLLLGHGPARIEMPSGGGQSAFFDLGNMALELREPPCEAAAASEAAGGPSSNSQNFGLYGLRLASDAGDLVARLEAGGLGVAESFAVEGRAEGEHTSRTWHIDRLGTECSRGLPVEIVSRESRSPVAGEERAPANPRFEQVDPAARVQSLDHVVVLSPAPEATRRFYAEGLGLRLALDKTFEERGVRLIFFRVGGTTIEIGGRLGVDPRPDRSDRFGGLAWRVVEIEAIQARLQGLGFDVSEIRTGNKPGTRVCTVRDPVHSVPTLLIEPVSGQG